MDDVHYTTVLLMLLSESASSGGPDWTQVVTALAGVGSTVIAFLGFFFLIRQVRDVERSVRGQTYDLIYGQMQALHAVFCDHPHLRAYFYDGKEVSPTDQHHDQVRAAAEMVADFFEQVGAKGDDMTKEAQDGWNRFMNDVCNNSPALQEHYRENGHWYTFIPVAGRT